jgi:hypothetical protein
MFWSIQAHTISPTEPSSKLAGGSGEMIVVVLRKVGLLSPYCPKAELKGPPSIRLRAAATN